MTSHLEQTLAFQLKAAGIDGWEREVRFAPPRRWRADFYWKTPPLIVECEGGVYSGGRHIRPAGFTGDARKYGEATARGFRVLRLTGEMVRNGEGLELIERALGISVSQLVEEE